MVPIHILVGIKDLSNINFMSWDTDFGVNESIPTVKIAASKFCRLENDTFDQF